MTDARRARAVMDETDADLAARKAALRAEAAARRAEAQARGGDDAAREACRLLLALIGAPGGPVAGYVPMRSELDPIPAMTALAEMGAQLCAPTVMARGAALAFRQWRPGCALAPDGFGCAAPRDGAEMSPRVVIVPLLAFDRRGMRLGYGGGYYDRTLAALRAQGALRAIGLAFAAQEVSDVPAGPRDAALDAIATEKGVILPAEAG